MGSIGEPAELPIVWPRDDPSTYNEACFGRVFNDRRPKRLPRAVVRATCEKDVVDAVQLAKQEGCRVSVRSGGHSWAAWSVRDNAILIDLGSYQFMEMDEARGIITVSPSTTGRTLNGFLTGKGYMFPGGHCPDVGIGGFLLQGGMGWNCKNWGWACENVAAIDAVTADGELIHCSETENQDLFWMARGGGPGFPAIVTKFHLRVRRLPAVMMQSFWCWPMSKYRKVLEWVAETSLGYNERTEIVAISQTIPGHSEPTICSLFLTFAESKEQAIADLEPANRTRPDGCLIAEINQPTTLADQYRNQAAANPERHRYCTQNAYIGNDADVATALEPAFTTLPSSKSFALYYAMNPCSRRPLPDMALSMHTDHYFAVYTVWEDAVDDDRCESWVREVMRHTERYEEGAYLGDSDFQERRTKFWSDENAKKLMSLRRKRDPDGRICGFLDVSDASGVGGLENRFEWKS